MPRHYLSRIKIEGFRGINNERDPLDLVFQPGSVNSVFAVNANGKSSLFEALSYAIRGHIPKLAGMQAGENPNQYYCNMFHSQKRATIDLTFAPDDGGAPVEVHIERDAAGNRTVSSPSGHPNPGAFLSTLNEAFTLLDYTTFTRFMEDSPLDRGRSFSALLGLSAYSDTRQALQAASETRTFNADFDIKVIETEINAAVSAAQQQLGIMRQAHERITGSSLEDVAKLDGYAADVVTALGGVEIIKEHLQGKLLKDVDFDAVKKTIREAEGGERRLELEQTIAAIVRFEVVGVIDAAATTQEQNSLELLVKERDELLASTRGDLFQRMYQSAMTLINGGGWTTDDKCPLCETGLDHSIKMHVQTQLEQYEAVADMNGQIKTAWMSASWVKRLATLENANLIEVQPAERLSAGLNQRVNSSNLTAEDLDAAKARLTELDLAVSQALTVLREKKVELEKDLPSSLVQLTEQVEYGRQFRDSLAIYKQKIDEEQAARARLNVRERWRKFIAGSAKTFADAETTLSKSTLAAIEKPYKAMFSKIMNVGDVVPDLQRVGDKEDLRVQLSNFHGKSALSAQALLSESYRNALAISVFLAAAVNHVGAPRFLVFDDVTSSFDSGHQWNLMELIRKELQQPNNPNGLQFIILSHDGLLQKYFDRQGGDGGWQHHTLQGSPPMGAILTQTQDTNRLKANVEAMLNAGQIAQAEPIIRQYLEFKLTQIIRKVSIPVPIDFAMKDHNRMVSSCLEAIEDAIDLHQKAGNLVLDAQQVKDLRGSHVPALVGNWVSHYETGSTASFSAPLLKGVMTSIDDLSECFRFDHTVGSSTSRRWYKSLSKKI